jgi:hypothetical protein
MYEIKGSVKVDMSGNRNANMFEGSHRISSVQHITIIENSEKKRIQFCCPRLLAHEHSGNAKLRNCCRYLPVDMA